MNYGRISDAELAMLVYGACAGGSIQKPLELFRLAQIVRDLRPKQFLEIGVHNGQTMSVWCWLAEPGEWMGIDLVGGRVGGHQAMVDRDNQMRRDFPGIHLFNQDSHWPSTAEDIRLHLTEGLLDFLFIDGDHSYAGVKQDYETFAPMVRAGGVIAFHDILDTSWHREQGCFVADFWKELTGPKEEIAFMPLTWGGIGVMRK